MTCQGSQYYSTNTNSMVVVGHSEWCVFSKSLAHHTCPDIVLEKSAYGSASLLVCTCCCSAVRGRAHGQRPSPQRTSADETRTQQDEVGLRDCQGGCGGERVVVAANRCNAGCECHIESCLFYIYCPYKDDIGRAEITSLLAPCRSQCCK